MREVYKNHDRYRGQAKRLAAHIEKEFEVTTIYNRFVTLLLGEAKLKWLEKLLNVKTYE
jgi:hypothetical protein